jgi:hypothetical protein
MSDVKLAVKTIGDPNQNLYSQHKVNSPLKKDVDSGFGNFHANLLNTGKDDTKMNNPGDYKNGKEERMAAIKRRMAKGY